MRGPWYATKRLFASFATATVFFEKLAPHGEKHKYDMGAPYCASKDINILNLRIGLFKAP